MRRYITTSLIIVSLCSIITTSTSLNITTLNNTDDTHKILAELGTSTDCEYCKYAHTALKNLYSENNPVNFEYITLIFENLPAAQRLGTDYNFYAFPTVFFDGGHNVEVGASSTESVKNKYNSAIETCGGREVADIDISISVDWVDDGKIDIYVSVKNNEITSYQGNIRIYVLEKNSTIWFDKFTNPYTNAFLYYALNTDLNIGPEETWQDDINWDGKQYNFDFLTRENTKIVAAVFNSEKNQGYARPPDQNPFDAYYIEDLEIATPTVNSNPPNNPKIHGKTKGKSGDEYEYTFSTVDPDGDDVYYWINWGDETNTGWLGPFSSGDEQSADHTWNKVGDFKIRIKAKDVNDVGCDYEKLNVQMPKIKHIIGNTMLFNLLKNNLYKSFKIFLG